MKTSAWLMVFFVSMNAFAGAMAGLGVTEHLGVGTEVGGNSELEQATEEARNINAGAGSIGETLFGAYNALASGVGAVIFTLLPATRLLANAGIPNPIVQWVGAAVPVLVGLDYAGFFRGSFLS
jgi:hypothetical protein